MKHTLVHALCLAVVVLGGTRLQAQSEGGEETGDYPLCLRYCMEEGFGFVYCREACGEFGDESL